MKFALLSHKLPPSGSGQAVIIEGMLRDLDPARYCLISTESYEGVDQGPLQRLKAKYYHLPPPFRIQRGHRFGLLHLREGMNIPLAIWQYSRQLADIIRREHCDAIVAGTGDVTLLPAAWLASRKTRARFYPYIFDHYSDREWADPAASFWAHRLQRRLMKDAAGVITLNEVLRDDLRDRFQIEPAIIYNPLDITTYEEASRSRSAAVEPDKSEVSIVYTGAVYEAHFDALRNLMLAINSLQRPGVKLDLYTNTRPDDLTAHGISGPVVRHPHVAASEMPRIQTEADILFLPLAFHSPYPNLVRTAAPTKLGEYLAARRPLLVHAPHDSFVSWYVRKHDCGVVVDEDDPAKLAQAIELILGDAELCRRLVSNAFERARTDFSISASRAAFARLLGLNGQSSR